MYTIKSPGHSAAYCGRQSPVGGTATPGPVDEDDPCEPWLSSVSESNRINDFPHLVSGNVSFGYSVLNLSISLSFYSYCYRFTIPTFISYATKSRFFQFATQAIF